MLLVCDTCGVIPADELYKSIPVLTTQQGIIIAAVLAPIYIALIVVSVVKILKKIKE